MTPPSITVAIPVKDRRERMRRCLEAVLALDYPNYDVLVLDNQSSDGTAEECARLAAESLVDVRVEVLDGNHGSLRNAAARMSRSELIAYTDSDCLPDRNWLSEAAGHFVREPRLGILQGVTLPEPGAPDEGWPATIEVREWTGRYETCNLIVRREALLEGGGFHEGVRTWEDTVGGLAVVRAGWKAAFEPSALVLHDVTFPGYTAHLRKVWRYGDAAAVVRQFPEIRRDLLWARFFLRDLDAKLLAALVGALLAPTNRRALALALPYAWHRRPRHGLSPDALKGTAQMVVFDLAILGGMLHGSLKYRALVF